MIVYAALLALQASQLTVGPQGDHATIRDALQAAAPGDTIVVTAGTYHEHLLLDRPVVLVGEPGTVIEGDGRGSVIVIRASATVRGFVIRGSGSDQSREDSGIIADGADAVRIEDNQFEDVLFGIYLKQCHNAIVRRNSIEGKNLALPLRGDGIHFWYSHNGTVTDNRLDRVRDLVIWFSDSTLIRGNQVQDSRYGLHYMYSDHNVFEDNAFHGNRVGAFIMYSRGITFRGNVFAHAKGTTGRGIGFKDSDDIRAVGNFMIKNAVGISLDNSPSSERASNQFEDNVVAYNDVAVAMLPSVHGNVFRANQFIDNVQPVAVAGGGTALRNRWLENYWSDYVGFDADGDGHGDMPFVYERLSDDLFAKHQGLRLYNLSLATTALNLLGRVFPLLAPEPVVVDSLPRLVATTRSGGPSEQKSSLPAAAGFFAAAVIASAIVPYLKRSAAGHR